MNDSMCPADRAFADFLSRARADPSVRGLLLHGSRVFDGMVTAHSDYDLGLITSDNEQGRCWYDEKIAGLDVWVARSLAPYRSEALDGDDTQRYIAAHSHVLIDRLDGELTTIVREAATFPARSEQRLPQMLDAYMNLLYRSLKNWRDGRYVEAHLDASASMQLALWVIFALHQRVRPPNKYLLWELQRHPLGSGPWDATQLLPRIQRILNDGDPDTQRSLFRDIESTARPAGLDDIVDGWGTDLALMHSAHAAGSG